jgi:hypothetical protein
VATSVANQRRLLSPSSMIRCCQVVVLSAPNSPLTTLHLRTTQRVEDIEKIVRAGSDQNKVYVRRGMFYFYMLTELFISERAGGG